MMSMKEDAKPVSFIEDCAVQLKDLAEYTDGLNKIFDKYNVKGTWYAHASVGCLHVRPVLNMKIQDDIKKMRNIANETSALVKKFNGSYSGEHGDGIARSEFNEVMFGKKPWSSSSTHSSMPLQVQNVESFVVEFDLEMQASGSYNLAFEFWVLAFNF